MTKKNITWSSLRKDPIYKLINGRSKIKDKLLLSNLIQEERIKKHEQDLLDYNMKTTILSEPLIESQNIMKWLDTKELGQYSRVSKDTYQIAFQQLKNHKHDRFIIGIYRWFFKDISSYDNRIAFFFENDITLDYISIQINRHEYTIGTFHLKKKISNDGNNNIVIRLDKTNENRRFILKKISHLFIIYNGNMTRDYKYHYNNFIVNGRLNLNEKTFLSTI
jgi:hypothetical protein